MKSKKILVNVLATDIRRGQKSIGGGLRTLSCPIASALRRVFKGEKEIGWRYTDGTIGGKIINSCSPKKTTAFVNKADDDFSGTNSHQLKPFSFYVVFKEDK